MADQALRRWTPLAVGVAVAAAGLTLGTLAPAGAGGGEHDHGHHGQGHHDHGHHGQGHHDHGHHGTSHHLNHVFIIMLENHSKGDVVGDSDMPYTTGLAHRYAEATNYYGVTHPSEPNYIAATSGSTWDTNDDDGWNSGKDYPRDTDTGGNHFPHRNIVDQLEANHIPWAAYMESMPEAGYLPDDWPEEEGVDPVYESKHNPFILYNDIRSDPQRREHIKPYDQMAADLNSGHAPRYVWITPNLCNDLHGGVFDEIEGQPNTPCPYGDAINQDKPENQLQRNADAFVKQAVRTIRDSKAWTDNSVIVVNTDENDFDAANEETGQWETADGCCDSPYLPEGAPYVSPDWPGGQYGGGLSPFIAITRNGPRGVTDDTAYNHYSLLRTIEQGFGLPYLGYASDGEQVQAMWPLIDGR